MRIQILSLSLIALLTVSCGSKEKVVAQEDAEPAAAELELQIQETPDKVSVETQEIQEKPDISCLPLTVDVPEDLEDWNPCEVIAIEKAETCLFISFQHSGCNEGAPKLFLLNNRNYELRTEGAGPCEMLLQSSAHFDINSLKLPSGKQTLKIGEQKISLLIP